MNKLFSDTNPQAEAVQLEIIRNMPPPEQLAKVVRMTSRLVGDSKAAIRRNHPDFSGQELQIAFIKLHYG